MKPDALTRAYLEKSALRLEILDVFADRGGYSDVVREAQEVVELLLKAVLRALGAEVPRVHDVGRVVQGHAALLPEAARGGLAQVLEVSRRLRRERELSFYGAEDFIPTVEYGPEDAARAIAGSRLVYAWVDALFAP